MVQKKQIWDEIEEELDEAKMINKEEETESEFYEQYGDF